MTGHQQVALGTWVWTFASWTRAGLPPAESHTVRCQVTELPSGGVQLYRLTSPHWLCGYVYRARDEFTVEPTTTQVHP